jgi:hypothetical protein
MSDLIGQRLGVFVITSDNMEKYATRILGVRCTVCNTETTRRYQSVRTKQGKTCIHCQRAMCKAGIIEILSSCGRMRRVAIQESLPNRLRRTESHIRRILGELVESNRLRAEMDRGEWIYSVNQALNA